MEKISRQWGYYSIVYTFNNLVKVKELTVDPGALLSMQKHSKRAENWFIIEGEATVYTLKNNETVLIGKYKQYESIHIDKMQWHRLCNETSFPLKIIEIQYGENCVEEDIEKK